LNLTRNAFLLALALALSFGGSAKAEMVGYSFSWSVGEVYVQGTGKGAVTVTSALSADGRTVTLDHGNGVVSLTVPPPGVSSLEPGSLTPTPFQAATLSWAAAAGTASAISFGAVIDLNLRLTDLASGESGELLLMASLGGGPPSRPGDQLFGALASWSRQEIILDGRRFWGSYDDSNLLMFPGLAGEPAVLYFDLRVAPRPGEGSGNPAGGGPFPAEVVPEPGSLALAVAALSGLAMTRWRVRRASKTPCISRALPR
jgi:hypothetical protein